MEGRTLISRLKRQIEKIVWITLFWIVISVFQFLTGYSTLIQLNCDLTGLNATTYFMGSILTGVTAGLIGGSFMVF
ncbi:MAG: hypothetical protein KAK04_03230, partial [Cyclobacteriaceae bacterium]|nr:hypothetical protein [Cyclobacteriaceae bacterium]